MRGCASPQTLHGPCPLPTRFLKAVLHNSRISQGRTEDSVFPTEGGRDGRGSEGREGDAGGQLQQRPQDRRGVPGEGVENPPQVWMCRRFLETRSRPGLQSARCTESSNRQQLLLLDNETWSGKDNSHSTRPGRAVGLGHGAITQTGPNRSHGGSPARGKVRAWGTVLRPHSPTPRRV